MPHLNTAPSDLARRLLFRSATHAASSQRTMDCTSAINTAGISSELDSITGEIDCRGQVVACVGGLPRAGQKSAVHKRHRHGAVRKRDIMLMCCGIGNLHVITRVLMFRVYMTPSTPPMTLAHSCCKLRDASQSFMQRNQSSFSLSCMDAAEEVQTHAW